jgi:hypothetical protein
MCSLHRDPICTKALTAFPWKCSVAQAFATANRIVKCLGNRIGVSQLTDPYLPIIVADRLDECVLRHSKQGYRLMTLDRQTISSMSVTLTDSGVRQGFCLDAPPASSAGAELRHDRRVTNLDALIRTTSGQEFFGDPH